MFGELVDVMLFASEEVLYLEELPLAYAQQLKTQPRSLAEHELSTYGNGDCGHHLMHIMLWNHVMKSCYGYHMEESCGHTDGGHLLSHR